MPELPDLQGISQALTTSENAAREVVAGLTQAQPDSPPTGEWSIPQCPEHVTLSNRTYSEAIGESLRRGKRPRRGAIAPSVIAPGLGKTREEVLTALLPLLRVRAGTGLPIMVAHERRHLWRASQLRAAMPESG